MWSQITTSNLSWRWLDFEPLLFDTEVNIKLIQLLESTQIKLIDRYKVTKSPKKLHDALESAGSCSSYLEISSDNYLHQDLYHLKNYLLTSFVAKVLYFTSVNTSKNRTESGFFIILSNVMTLCTRHADADDKVETIIRWRSELWLVIGAVLENFPSHESDGSIGL